ncbi:MAG: hypothetical protein Q9219_003484 [cf. Caloplaca sp. 3 TL-2023]
MAEALVAVGLSASIVQFVSATAKLAQRIDEFNSMADEIPKALRSIHTQLPFLLETCRTLDGGDESENIAVILRECQMEIEDLHKSINKVLPAPGDPRLNRAIKALKSIHHQERFDAALRRIEHFKTDLLLYCCRYTTQRTTKTLPVQKIAHNLPSVPLVFSITRRRLLREISVIFSDYEFEDSKQKIVVLHGMGGQGKSRLALDYGRQVSKQPEAHLALWFDATSKRSMTRSFEDIADRWNGRSRRFVDFNSRISFVHEVLAERQWLLIFDNYDHPDCFTDISTFFPPGDGSILITSRHADVGLLGKVVSISKMDEAEGLELLHHRTQQNLNESGNRAAAIEVLQKLGYLPLAIDQAGAYIREQRLPLRMFLQHYESQKGTILNQKHIYWNYVKKLHGEEEAETPLGVLTTWELSIQQVESPHATRGEVEHLLTVAAFLNHVEVNERLFQEYALRTRPSPKWLLCFASSGEWDSEKFNKVLSRLLTLSLAQGQRSNTGDCYLSLHPMIKDWLQSRIVESERPAYILETMNLLATFIEGSIQERSLQEARGLLGHLDACLSSHSRFDKAKYRLGFGHLRKHGVIFSHFYMSHGRYREAEEGFEAVLEHDIQTHGRKHSQTFQTTRHLAEALLHGGKYQKAHDILANALNNSKDMADLETLHIVSALAGIFTKMNRQIDAERYYESAMRAHTLRKDSAGLREVCILYERLAGVKRYLVKYEEAKDLYAKAYAGFEQDCAYDEDATHDMLRTAGGLADLYRVQGQYAEAERSYREAWRGYKIYFGADHPKTTYMLTQLAISCRNQGNFVDAQQYLEESAMVFSKSLGADHPDSLRALMNLALCIDKQEHYKEAETIYWEVLKGREKRLGLNHPYTQRTLERLAHMLWMQGQHDKAETVVRRVLIKAQRPFTRSQSGSSDDSRFPAMIALYTEARQRDQSKLSHDHVDALETLECLRLVYLEQGEQDRAKELFDQIQGARKKQVLVGDHKKSDNRSDQSEKHHDPAGSNHNLTAAGRLQDIGKSLTRNTLIARLGLLLPLALIFWSIYLNWPKVSYNNHYARKIG